MSGTLEKVSSTKTYGGDLTKYKFKVGRASYGLSLVWRLLTRIGGLGSTVCRARWFGCTFQSVFTCKLRKCQGPSAYLLGGFNLHGR